LAGGDFFPFSSSISVEGCFFSLILDGSPLCPGCGAALFFFFSFFYSGSSVAEFLRLFQLSSVLQVSISFFFLRNVTASSASPRSSFSFTFLASVDGFFRRRSCLIGDHFSFRRPRPIAFFPVFFFLTRMPVAIPVQEIVEMFPFLCFLVTLPRWRQVPVLSLCAASSAAFLSTEKRSFAFSVDATTGGWWWVAGVSFLFSLGRVLGRPAVVSPPYRKLKTFLS